MIFYHPGRLLLFFAKLLNRFFTVKDRELNDGWQSSLLTRFSYCDRVRKLRTGDEKGEAPNAL
jgi:hypothetical protein